MPVHGDGLIQWQILPSTLFSKMHACNRTRFVAHFAADKPILRRFWEELFSSPQGQRLRTDHKFLRGQSPADLETSVPLTLHEDALPYGVKKSAAVISFASLLWSGSDFEAKYVIMTHIKASIEERMESKDAWDELLDDFDTRKMFKISYNINLLPMLDEYI